MSRILLHPQKAVKQQSLLKELRHPFGHHYSGSASVDHDIRGGPVQGSPFFMELRDNPAPVRNLEQGPAFVVFQPFL